MNVDRQAEIVKQSPERTHRAARGQRATSSGKTLERYVERLLDAARRLRQGPEASELLCAAAELYEGTTEDDPARATRLYGQALEAFALSRPAHLGLRRIARRQGDTKSTLAALEREIANASGARARELRFELARTLLYQGDKPSDAIVILEKLEEERKARPVSAAADVSGGTPVVVAPADPAKLDSYKTLDVEPVDDDAPQAPVRRTDAAATLDAWMGIDAFFVWEEALWATGQWRRYEELLREALAQRHATDDVTQMLERRLLHLYLYVVPDSKQAELIINHLVEYGDLDTELVEHALRRLERDGQRDDMVDLLTRALAEPACSDHETTYRMLLADIARHHFDDIDHATDIIRAGLDSHAGDPILIRELLALQEERGDVAGLVDALGSTLEILTDRGERADVLHRIGTILSEQLDLEEAAEEVYIEAIKELPTHRPTLRALGRIYQSRQDWYALAELLQGELDATPADDGRWRKHVQLAELFEERLADPSRAFDQYREALSAQPAYLPALKGASRLTAQMGNWTDLLELYAAAEGATADPRQQVYLLERIAQIAEEHLDDLETARTALEGLRALDPRHPGALTSLARLYARLGRFDALVALTDEELGWTQDDETAAALLARNGELCEEQLSDEARAAAYYAKALERVPTFQPALEGLGRLLRRQERWQDLVDMGLSEADAWGERSDASRRLHAVADLLERQLDDLEGAIALYLRCIERDVNDRVARGNLARLYRAAGQWDKVCDLLEMEAEHGASHPGAILFRVGQIHEHRLHDQDRALDAYRRAFLSDPGNPVLMRAWLSMARKLGALDGPRKILTNASAKPASPEARADLLLTLAEFSMLETGDPLTAAGFLEIVEKVAPERETGATLLAMAYARSGRWTDRIRLALAEFRTSAERQHGLEAALAAGVTDEHVAPCRRILAGLDNSSGRADAVTDLDEATLVRTWSLFPPAQRPHHKTLPRTVRASVRPEAQDLRRWKTIRALAAGECPEPSKPLLPGDQKHYLTLRPDMELLAAHYETHQEWNKLLEVFAAQEEMAPNSNERVRTALDRAEILVRLGKHKDALALVRGGCDQASFADPVRSELYAFLERVGDWDHLIAQLRKQLMHTEAPATQADLWRQLSHALENGVGDLHEALRALDAAYRSYPGDGELLTDIARVAEELGEVAIARRAMDDFLAYHRPPIEAELAVAKRFVELHIDYPGGDPQRVIAYLQDLTERSCDDHSALDALAEAHAKAGSPIVACDALMRLAKLPYREPEVGYWLRLGALYAGPMGEWVKAEALHWEILAHFPHNPQVWAAIERLYAGPRLRRELADRLRAFVDASEEHGLDKETRRHFLGILGALLGDELGLWKEARVAYNEALELAEVSSPDLSRQRAYAMCRIPGERASAYRGFCDLLVENPFQTDLLGAAIELCESSGAHDRARILRQVAETFVPEARLHVQDIAVRPKLVVSRELGENVLQERLLVPELRALYDVLHESLPIIEATFRDQIPKLSVIGGKRIKGRDETADVFDDIGSRLGIGSVKIYLGNDESPVPMVFSSPAAFWIPNDRWQAMDDFERRHWAGYAAGLLWTGLAPLVYLDGRDVWQLLDGVYYSTCGKGLNGRTAYTIEASEKVKSPWYRRARKEIAVLLDEAGISARGEDADRWPDYLRASGDRAGLLFSGDVGTSVRAMLAGEGWGRGGELSGDALKSLLARYPRARQLLDFALSEDYLHLRHVAGLAQKPSAIEG